MLTSNVTSEIMNAINKQFSLQRSIPEVHSEYWSCLYASFVPTFFLQLVVFARAALYTRSTNGGITAVADTSIGLSLTVGCFLFFLLLSLLYSHNHFLYK